MKKRGKISKLSFQVNGDHDIDGKIYLKEALSWNAKVIEFPLGLKGLSVHNLLDKFMINYNKKLKSHLTRRAWINFVICKLFFLQGNLLYSFKLIWTMCCDIKNKTINQIVANWYRHVYMTACVVKWDSNLCFEILRKKVKSFKIVKLNMWYGVAVWRCIIKYPDIWRSFKVCIYDNAHKWRYSDPLNKCQVWPYFNMPGWSRLAIFLLKN